MYPLGFVSSCASGSPLPLSLFTNKLVCIACVYCLPVSLECSETQCLQSSLVKEIIPNKNWF